MLKFYINLISIESYQKKKKKQKKEKKLLNPNLNFVIAFHQPKYAPNAVFLKYDKYDSIKYILQKKGKKTGVSFYRKI